MLPGTPKINVSPAVQVGLASPPEKRSCWCPGCGKHCDGGVRRCWPSGKGPFNTWTHLSLPRGATPAPFPRTHPRNTAPAKCPPPIISTTQQVFVLRLCRDAVSSSGSSLPP